MRASFRMRWYARTEEAACQNGIYLVLPLGIFPADPNPCQLIKNMLLVISPTGAIVMEHVKYGGYIFEGYQIRGDGKLQNVDTLFGVHSGEICWDMDYPATIQQAGQNGTGLLLIPSLDWFEIDPVHIHMAVFRTVMNLRARRSK